MQLNQHQLTAYLRNIKSDQLPRFFWLNSSDNYLLQDAAKQIKNTLRSFSYNYSNDNKIVFHIDSSTDWLLISNTIQTPGLFCTEQLIELCFINKITLEQQQELVKLAEILKSNNNAIIIIIYPFKIESKILKQKWMVNLNNLIDPGAIITLWPLSTTDYPKWLSKQLQKYRLNFTDNSLFDYFCQKTMCNPSMASQTMYKLKLQDVTTVNQEILLATLAEHANYDTFDLINSYLLGNLKQALIILKILKNNETEPLLILGALRKELHIIANTFEQAIASKQSPQQILKNLNLWQSKINILSTAIHKLNLDLVYKKLAKISSIELLVKTSSNKNFIWQQINELLLLSVVNVVNSA